jgi:hypothetical protein
LETQEHRAVSAVDVMIQRIISKISEGKKIANLYSRRLRIKYLHFLYKKSERRTRDVVYGGKGEKN